MLRSAGEQNNNRSVPDLISTKETARADVIAAPILGLVLLCVAATSTAHHSPSMFDQEQKKSISGTVREFQWTNPHCYVQLLVRNAKGVQEEWSFEMGAPTYLYGRGWRPSDPEGRRHHQGDLRAAAQRRQWRDAAPGHYFRR